MTKPKKNKKFKCTSCKKMVEYLCGREKNMCLKCYIIYSEDMADTAIRLWGRGTEG